MKRQIIFLSMLAIFAMTLAACGGAAETPTEPPEELPVEPVVEEGVIDCMGGEGSEISMLATWSGDEEARLIEIFQPLIDACNIIAAFLGGFFFEIPQIFHQISDDRDQRTDVRIQKTDVR